MAKFKTLEEFSAACKQYYEKHPDAPIAQGIDCLNLIMRRAWAEKILAGTKKLEFREYKPFYIKKLIDPAVEEWIGNHVDDEDTLTFCNDIRQVKKIHFHDYNNSWYLDIEVTYNDIFGVNAEDINMLHEKYDCHDFDDDLKALDAADVPIDERPWVFYFVCGRVISTNLK